MSPRRTRTSFSSDDPTTTVTLSAAAIPTPTTFADNLPLPKLIVFDLDYTLWPFWVDTHVDPPIKKSPKDNGLTVRDAYGSSFGFYNDVAGVLSAIKDKGIKVGCASRTCTPDLAHKMLSLLQIPSSEKEAAENGTPSSGSSGKTALSMFDYLEMYPGSKTNHFQKIEKKSGIPYEEMLFFDDESRNRNVEESGVAFQLVNRGVTLAEFDKGVQRWREKNQRTKNRREG